MSTRILEQIKGRETSVAQVQEKADSVTPVSPQETEVHELDQVSVDRMLVDALGADSSQVPTWTRVGRGLVAFYDWISGPGMTERERLHREVFETSAIRNFRGEI